LLKQNFLSDTSHRLANYVKTGLKSVTAIKANGAIETIGRELQFASCGKHLVGGKTTGNRSAINLNVIFSVDVVIEIKRKARVAVSVKLKGAKQIAQAQGLD
jgi:hypothetical protein